MSGIQKVIVSTLSVIIFAVTSSSVSLAQAQPPSLDGLKSQIPAPVNDFINSVQQVRNGVTYKSNWINRLSGFNPRDIFNEIDNWFYNTTGTRLVDILKPVGNLLIWLFIALANLIKWGLSLI